MGLEQRPDDQRQARRALIIWAVTAAVLSALLAVLLWRAARDTDSSTVPTAVTRSTVDPTPPGTVSPDVSLAEVAGVQLPVSRRHGPRVTSNGRAGWYAHTERGAALAAVQVLLRTSATAGPRVYRPVMTSQVTGVNTAAMSQLLDQQYEQLRSQRGIAAGEAIPGNDAAVAGYLIPAHDAAAKTATVAIVLTSPSLPPGQLLRFDVSVVWASGDWRVVAPPRGDWGSVSTVLTARPPGLLDYRQEN